jgi:hypothetical protein
LAETAPFVFAAAAKDGGIPAVRGPAHPPLRGQPLNQLWLFLDSMAMAMKQSKMTIKFSHG